MKVPNSPDGGKRIVNGKGVCREAESEGSRMANLWPDEQKSSIRFSVRIRLLYKSKSYNHTKALRIEMAGI